MSKNGYTYYNPGNIIRTDGVMNMTYNARIIRTK